MGAPLQAFDALREGAAQKRRLFPIRVSGCRFQGAKRRMGAIFRLARPGARP
jgi:hypothetical protein